MAKRRKKKSKAQKRTKVAPRSKPARRKKRRKPATNPKGRVSRIGTYTILFKRRGDTRPVLKLLGRSLRADLIKVMRRHPSGGVYFNHPRFRVSYPAAGALLDQVERVLLYDAGRRRKPWKYGDHVRVVSV